MAVNELIFSVFEGPLSKSFIVSLTPELQKGGILVSRIPDISGRKFGHFQIVAADLSIFGMKRFNTVDLLHSSTPNE